MIPIIYIEPSMAENNLSAKKVQAQSMSAQDKQIIIKGFKSNNKSSTSKQNSPVFDPATPTEKRFNITYNWLRRKPKTGKSKGETEHGGQKVDGGGGGGGVVDGRRSVSHVETNLGSVSTFLQVKVLVADMPGSMKVHAFRCARRSYDSLEKFSSKHMAYNIKKELDKAYGPAWHCIVGSSFGSFVTHSTGCFLYFSMEKLCVLLFRTKIQKALND